MAKLFWLQPDSSIPEFPLKGEQNLIGRTSGCDVHIKHPGISAEHALIRVRPGSATLEDLDSANGSRVNGKKVELHTLRHGDPIGVGREHLIYFAELDKAAEFLQPESVEPFAMPAAGGECVNTTADDPVKPPTISSIRAPAPPVAVLMPSPAKFNVGANMAGLDVPDLELEGSLLAALPKGVSLVDPPIAPIAPNAKVPMFAPLSDVISQKIAPPAFAATPSKQPLTTAGVRVLSASVAVLTGASAGKRYPLNEPAITLGKAGRQVVEVFRISPTRWQIRQLEGITPAYINGDALAGLRNLSAGDVVELTGVRVRFEITIVR